MMRTGIHVHPHDIVDEGPKTVIGRLQALMPGTDPIIGVNTLFERHPYPAGALPHNPLHGVVRTKGRLALSSPAYKRLRVRQRIEECSEAIMRTFTVARRAGMRPLPWLSCLNGAYTLASRSCAVQTWDGTCVPEWLCPAQPESLHHAIELCRLAIGSLGACELLLDRVRYPDWSGAVVAPERLLSCFCPACRQRIAATGIDVEQLIARLHSMKCTPRPGFSRAWLEDDTVKAWLRVRSDIVTDFVRRLREELKREFPRTHIYLNLWPPSQSYLLGQDYRRLQPHCDGAKFFPYHRLGGGAALAHLVDDVPPAYRETFFRGLLELWGLSYAISYEDFQAEGFPETFVTDETRNAVALMAPKPVFTGIQLWDLPVDRVLRGVQAALSPRPQGLFLYCYGWTSLSVLGAVGQWLTAPRLPGGADDATQQEIPT